MRARVVVAVLVVAACGGSSGPGQQAAAPPSAVEPPPAVAEAPAAPAPESDEISVTSKSPEAIEHFRKGRELIENQRVSEGVEHLKKAVELDPGFAQAIAYLGGYTPGNERFALVDRAAEMTKGLPEPERLFVEAQRATVHGDRGKAQDLLRQLVAAKPKDWRVQLQVAQRALADESWTEAVTASQKVLEVAPTNPLPYNLIAYAEAYQGRWEEAIAAARKQVELLPDEPNPHDTLGEILLAAGRLDEAQAAFEKAIAKSPAFHMALVGVAEIQMYKGDWKAGYATLKKARDAAPRPQDAAGVSITEMWALGGQGKLSEALKAGVAAEKATQEQGRPVVQAFVALNRALLLALSGKRADALKLVDTATAMATKTELAAPLQRNLTMLGEQVRLVAAWKARKPADAEKAYAALEAAARGQEMTTVDQSTLAWAQGLLAWTKGDAKAAVESMRKCSQLDYTCRFMAVQAQRAAGDKAGAAEALAALKRSPRRAIDYVYFWSAAR
jgi:tetratricopeptide (TPR) repeat protein